MSQEKMALRPKGRWHASARHRHAHGTPWAQGRRATTTPSICLGVPPLCHPYACGTPTLCLGPPLFAPAEGRSWRAHGVPVACHTLLLNNHCLLLQCFLDPNPCNLVPKSKIIVVPDRLTADWDSHRTNGSTNSKNKVSSPSFYFSHSGYSDISQKFPPTSSADITFLSKSMSR